MYSHPAYFRQNEQYAPHRSWQEERSFLKQLFPSGTDMRLGTPEHGTDVFAASFARGSSSTWIAAEVYITDLEQPTALSTFSNESKLQNREFWNARGADKVDEFYFEPSGYSANTLRGNVYSTMHASPQPSVSYVSHATNALMSQEELKRMVEDTLELAPGKHVGLFVFTFSPLLASAMPASSFDIQGFSQNGAWKVEQQDFYASLLSLAPAPPSICSSEQLMNEGGACMSNSHCKSL